MNTSIYTDVIEFLAVQNVNNKSKRLKEKEKEKEIEEYAKFLKETILCDI